MPDFYPRPPRGGRRDDGQHSKALREDFYPRPPRGGRLDLLPNLTPEQKISIHALREEGDYNAKKAQLLDLYFYPRPPRGGRRAVLCAGQVPQAISIHALREEGDACNVVQIQLDKISIHALREEGDAC